MQCVILRHHWLVDTQEHVRHLIKPLLRKDCPPSFWRVEIIGYIHFGFRIGTVVQHPIIEMIKEDIHPALLFLGLLFKSAIIPDTIDRLDYDNIPPWFCDSLCLSKRLYWIIAMVQNSQE